jgi:hypothetical protein
MSKKYNAADERELAEAEKLRVITQEQDKKDLRLLLSMPEGLRFFRKLFEEGKIFSTTFTGNSQTFFLEGHRNFALKIFHDCVEACPEVVPGLIIKKQNDGE